MTLSTFDSPHSRHLTDRATSVAVGVLYIIGTVAGILSVVLTSDRLDGPDYLANAQALGSRLAVAALLIFLMGLTLAAIPLLMFPILRATSERLAIGYVIFRGALEMITYMVAAASWLVLFQLGRNYTANVPDATGLQAVGVVLDQVVKIATGPVALIIFPIGAAMFYWVLFESRLVPRWLSGWGLFAVVPYLALGVLEGVAIADPGSLTETILVLPMGLQEMVLALWLIIRGFAASEKRKLSVTNGSKRLRAPPP